MANMDSLLIQALKYQEDELNSKLDDLRDEYGQLIRSQGTTIKNEDKIQKYIPLIIEGYIIGFIALLKDTNQQVSEIVGLQEYKGAEKFFKKFSEKIGSEYLPKFEQTINQYTEGISDKIMFRKIFEDNITLTERIKRVQDGSTKTVRNIIAVGMEEGKSAVDIAKDVEQYVKPEEKLLRVSPYKWYRDRFPSFTAKNIKDIPPGSISYNSFLIARTETAYTYRNTTIALNKNKPWVIGYDWNLSRSHPEPDICDKWAEDSPYKPGHLPSGHPNCICYTTAKYATEKDFEKYLNKGTKPKQVKSSPAVTLEKYNK